MSTQNSDQSSATQDTGIAQSPLENSGQDDFNSLLDGGAPEAPSRQEPVEQDLSKPPTTLSKPAAAAPVQSQQGTTQQQAAPVASPATLDPKIIEEIVAASARGMQSGQQQSKAAVQQQSKDAQEMTPQQFNDKYGIVQVTPQHIAAILDQDPQKAAAALNNILIANTRSAVLMAQDIVAAQLKAARSEYEPHVASWQSYQAKQAEEARQNTFYKTYPDLANEKELVQEMIDSLTAKKQAGQVSFQSEQQVFQAVAEASRKLLARMNKQSSAPQAGTSQQQSQQAPQRQMAAASTAGRSGTGSTASKSDVDEVFGADAR